MSNPDLRLGQLIFNAADSAVADGIEPCPELFYMEDAVLLEGLSRVNLS